MKTKITIRSNKTMLTGHLAGIMAVAMWGYSFVASKVLLENDLGPIQIYTLRFIIAYLLIICINHKKLWANSISDEILLALCGLTSGTLYFIAENFALQYTLATNVALLTSMSPLMTAILLAILYRGEKLGLGTWIGSGLAIMGVACVVFNSASGVSIHPLGDLLSLVAALNWAIYSLILRKISAGYDVWFITRKTFFYGILTAIPFLFFEEWPADICEVLLRGEVVGNLLFLGLGASTIAFLLWAQSVRTIGAISSNNYLYFQSVLTMIISYYVLSEPITITGICGIILIVGGLWVGDKFNIWLDAKQTRR